MVTPIVLAALAMLIALAALVYRHKHPPTVAAPPAGSNQTAGLVPVVAGVALPDTLAYHPGHAWAFDAGNGRVRVGLDEFASRLLGKIVRVDTLQRGRWFRQGEKGWTLVTAKGEVNMLAPAEGEIVAVNDKALANPDCISRDPYGSWLLEIYSPDAQVSFRNLLSGAFAQRWMEESMLQLRQALSPAGTAAALDGGRIASELGLELPQQQWNEVTRRFFRT